MPSETTETLFARYGPGYRWLATVTVMLGTVSAVLTTTSVNVAIPDIMGAFGIGQDRAQWLSTGTLAAMTVGMLLNAWLMATFGQRATFVGRARRIHRRPPARRVESQRYGAHLLPDRTGRRGGHHAAAFDVHTVPCIPPR